MAGILDFLSGAPDLATAGELGNVDPATLKAFQAIRNQAQTSAIGPALIGGLMSALAGRRQGAGIRALEGAGRAYTGAEQRAEQEQFALPAFADRERAAALKEKEAALNMEQKKAYIKATNLHADYLKWQMAHKDQPMDPTLGGAMLDPLIHSSVPEIAKAASMIQDQFKNGKLDSTQFDKAITHLGRMQQDAVSNSDVKLMGHESADGSQYFVQRYNKQGQEIGPPSVINTGAPKGNTPKPKSFMIYGTGPEKGKERMVTGGPGYEPPENFTTIKPSKAEDAAALQGKLETINVHYTTNEPLRAKLSGDNAYKKEWAESLIKAGDTVESAKDKSGYTGDDLADTTTSTSSVDNVVNKYLK